MSAVIQSLYRIPSGYTYINPLPIIIMFHGGNGCLVYDVLRVVSSAQGAFPFSSIVTMWTSSGSLLFQFNSSSNLLLWLFKILCISFVQELQSLTVFLSKIFPNGLSQFKCLSRRFRKYLPMLMLVSLQNGGLNQITLLFLFFLVYLSDYFWCYLPWRVHGSHCYYFYH